MPKTPRRRGRRAAWLSILIGATTVLIASSSCREATQISIEVTTNVVWRDGIVTTFTVGAPGATELVDTTTDTSVRWNESDHFVGSLTIVPKASDDGAVAVKIVMGALTTDAKKCVAPDYKGCIVARRRLLFVPHERLRLPITMFAACVDVPCDEGSTCNALQQCVPATVDPSTCDSPRGCEPPNIGSSTPPAALPDSGSDGASFDARFEDVANDDAAADAQKDGAVGVDAGAGSVVCGTLSCRTPDFFCCFKLGSSTCMVAGSGGEQQCVQQFGGIALRCDGRGDCPGQICCTASNTSACSMTCGTVAQELCQDSPFCEGTKQCTGTINGYASCE